MGIQQIDIFGNIKKLDNNNEYIKESSFNIARIFPRKTKASPDDNLSFFGSIPLFLPDVKEVHISVTFSWDIPKAERLADQCSKKITTKINGPAFGIKGQEFVSGFYLKKGYVITSRGCPNKCWFCSVWKREGNIRELSITEGTNVLDDNLLACSEKHIRAVFEMLKKQKGKIQFTGGLEAARLKDWHIDLLLSIKLYQAFFAYDTVDDYEPLLEVSKKLTEAGLIRKSSHCMRCYVLVGYNGDTFEKAETRLKKCLKLGFFPAAMLYRPENGEYKEKWKKFQRNWMRPVLIAKKIDI